MFVGKQFEKPDSIKRLMDIIEEGGQAGLGIRHHTDPASLGGAEVTGNLISIYFEVCVFILFMLINV